jgi:hypothetical protein
MPPRDHVADLRRIYQQAMLQQIDFAAAMMTAPLQVFQAALGWPSAGPAHAAGTPAGAGQAGGDHAAPARATGRAGADADSGSRPSEPAKAARRSAVVRLAERRGGPRRRHHIAEIATSSDAEEP